MDYKSAVEIREEIKNLFKDEVNLINKKSVLIAASIIFSIRKDEDPRDSVLDAFGLVKLVHDEWVD